MYSAAGLLAFFAYSCVADELRSWIATLMVSNGLSYHGACYLDAKPRQVLFWWDVAFCGALGLYLNVASVTQPWTVVASALILASWRVGHAVDPRYGHCVHVVGVQLLTLACLATSW